MTRYADVIIDISHEKVDRPFQYRIPERMQEQLEAGMCVMVPFGSGNRLRRGYVTEITEKILRRHHDSGAKDRTARQTIGEKD